jgi:multimeric flavodoxin WrbA
MGSPRISGNTAELLKPFISELKIRDCEIEYIALSDKEIKHCMGCFTCQHIADKYSCVIKDDVEQIMDSVIKSDIVVFATPIYTWYCTAPMKALLDRHYGLNKFYGTIKGSLWEGKKIALITTHGYDKKYATEPFEIGIKRLCEHSNLRYMGMYSVRDEDNISSFQTEEAIKGAKEFALRLIKSEENKVIFV